MQNLRLIAGKLRTTSIVLALLGGVLVVNPAAAQYKPSGDDGITASPRFRQQLDERKTSPTPAAARPIASCGKCKDTLVPQRTMDTKGAGSRVMTGSETRLVAKHLCNGCGTDWKVAGSGKSKQMVATHTCKDCGSENHPCCTGVSSTNGIQKAS